MGFQWDFSKPLKKVCAKAQVAKVKVTKNSLILKFRMMLLAVIFDLNHKSPNISKRNYLVCFPENVRRLVKICAPGTNFNCRVDKTCLLIHICKSFTQHSTKNWRNTKILAIRICWKLIILSYCTKNISNRAIYFIRYSFFLFFIFRIFWLKSAIINFWKYIFVKLFLVDFAACIRVLVVDFEHGFKKLEVF